MMKQVKFYCHRNTSSDSKSVLLRITGTSTLVLRRSDIEAVSQGELDTTRIVVFYLANHKTIAVKGKTVNATVEEIVTCQLDIQMVLKEVFANAEREYGIGTIEPNILLVAVRMYIEVGL